VAVVYLARDERQDRQVALKILAPELGRDPAFRPRFLSETRAAAVIGHPNIIGVYDVGEAAGNLYLAMRYVHGGDARSLLNRFGPLPAAWASTIIAQVASALDAAHAHGLIHGDVRPASMLLDATSPPGRGARRAGGHFDRVYLSDFGMSKLTATGEATATGQAAGTFEYVAPEYLEGHRVDGRADLYSLACAGFELLCGSPPFAPEQGPTVMCAQLYEPPPAASARRRDLPPAVDMVLATALAKNPDDRYPTCGQFAEHLHAALGLRPGELYSLDGWRPPGGRRPASDAVEEPTKQLVPDELAWAPAPVLAEPDWPWYPPAQPPAGPGRASTDTMMLPGPPDPPLPGRRPGMTRLLLAAAAVAMVAGTVAACVALSRGSRPGESVVSPASSSAPSTSSASALASRQAADVSGLLGSSAATRRELQGAVDQVRYCMNLSGAVGRIRGVVNQRSAEDSQASALTTAALANGGTLKSDLIAVLRDSLQADRDYLIWARQQLSSGCVPAAASSAYNSAFQADQQARVAKQAFAGVWDPVAAQYGVWRTSPGSI